MPIDDEGRADERTYQRIDDAFRRGDLEALRQAVGEAGSVPNGPVPEMIGNCLVYAIYWSPLAFIRTLLELGADPNPPIDDGFPPLIAALTKTRDEPGSMRRSDVDDLLRLLLARGADPNQRGINDYTPLHMAVAERNGAAVQILLDGGADPDLRTRIDDYETPLEMARAAGLDHIAAILERRGAPLAQRMRGGLTLLVDIPGTGEPVRRQATYRVRLRMWLDDGRPVLWQDASDAGSATAADDREARVTEIRINRGALISGLFYGVEGMRVGGTRRLAIAPRLAYGDRGVAGLIPPGATLTVEIAVLDCTRLPPSST